MRNVLSLFLTVCAMTLGAAQAQEKNESLRARVSNALAKGDTAAAQKVMLELTANMKLAPGAAATPQWNTSFEELRACGFHPQQTRLTCVIDIKQQGGYGGGISSFGSFETVSFFIDWANDGFTITDYVGSGTVHLADGSETTSFVVYRDFDPPGSLLRSRVGGASTSTVTTYNALAKLSWTFPSITPGAPVPWGNELTFRIRFLPIR